MTPGPDAGRSAPDAAADRGRLVVLSGPSGVGKGTVIARIRERYPSLWVSISVTTRLPRPGEVDGVQYHFVTEDEFEALVADGAFLEHAAYAGNNYGTPREPVEERLGRGEPALIEVEVQGARQVRASMPEALLVFLAPPSWEELVRRLVGRGTEDQDSVTRRLEIAGDELSAEDEFDQVVINYDIGAAADRVVALTLNPLD
ncbi:MAG: guanylate kinase [Mycobacteriales bacterium]